MTFHAEFELTNHCNTRCLHCPHETMSRPKGRLAWQTYRTVTDKIRKYCAGEPYSLSFSGMGEPLLHPEIFAFIKHVSHEAKTSFATNGSALTEDNVRRLIEAGCREVYFSFNGAEPELYARMMGGLKFDRALHHLRRAVDLARGTSLTILANISVTKANRDQLTEITELLQREGIAQPSYAMAHSRGGNLIDPAVVDTPPLPPEVTHCEVVRNTLFIDWRGQVFICDHDLHGENCLGDLMTESLEVIQGRRQRLIDNGVTAKICERCTDVLKMGTQLFGDLRSGTLRDWVYDVYRTEVNEPLLAEATAAQRWLFSLYEKEGQTARMINGLLKRNKALEQRGEDARAFAARIQELDVLARERETRILQLEAERKRHRSFWTWRVLKWESMLRRWWGEA